MGQSSYPVTRRWRRYDLQVPVRVVVHRPAYAACISGRGTELNEGGMSVFAGIEMRLGDQVAVEFTPPYGSGPLRLWAAVRNRCGYYYGLEFLAENNGESREVDRFRTVLRAQTGQH